MVATIPRVGKPRVGSGGSAGPGGGFGGQGGSFLGISESNGKATAETIQKKSTARTTKTTTRTTQTATRNHSGVTHSGVSYHQVVGVTDHLSDHPGVEWFI